MSLPQPVTRDQAQIASFQVASFQAPLPIESPAVAAPNLTQRIFTAPAEQHAPASAAREVTVVVNKDLQKDLLQAKSIEWDMVLKAMSDAFDEFIRCHETKPTPVPDILQVAKELFQNAPLPDPELHFAMRVERIMLGFCLTAKKPVPQNPTSVATSLIQKLKTSTEEITNDVIKGHLKQALDEYGIVLDDERLLNSHSLELFLEWYACFKSQNSFKDEWNRLLNYVYKLSDFLTRDYSKLASDDKRQLALDTLYRLREGLNSRAYCLLRTDEKNLAVQLLHRLCFAAYADTDIMSAYSYFGSKLYEKAQIPKDGSLEDSLTKAYDRAVEHGIPTDDPPPGPFPFLQRLAQAADMAIHAMRLQMSLSDAVRDAKMWESSFFSPHKDYHAFHDNNPGKLCTEHFSQESRALTARTIIAPSPAAGERVVEEFSGLLQTLENHHFPEVLDTNDPCTALCLAASNLQNKVTATGPHRGSPNNEGLQTETQMHLNLRYPYSFRGITVAQDPFKSTRFDDHLRNDFYQNLIAEQNFTLSKPPSGQKCIGYYFPLNQKELWVKELRFLVDEAYALVAEHAKADVTDEKKVESMTALVRMGITRFHEAFTLHEMDRTHKRPETTILQTRSCAVVADRGVLTNAEFLWAQSDASWDERIVSFIEGRPLMAKKRQMQRSRLDQMINLISIAPRAPVKQFLDNIAQRAFGQVPQAKA